MYAYILYDVLYVCAVRYWPLNIPDIVTVDKDQKTAMLIISSANWQQCPEEVWKAREIPEPEGETRKDV